MQVPVLLKTVNLLTLGTNPTCTTLTVVVDPASLTGTIEIVDCANNKHVGYGARMIVNPGPNCWESCYAGDPSGPVCEPVWDAAQTG